MKIKIILILMLLSFTIYAQQNQKRNRGESYFNLRNSNTVGHGDLWLNFRGVGHIWDDDPISLDNNFKTERKWISNVRVFPEFKIESGLFNFASLSLESRLLSYGFRPGYVLLGLKLTTPNNLDLRLHGFGFEFGYLYNFIESNPTLGGYTGFMPEGFVVKGNSLDFRFLYELDLLARYSYLPIKFLLNLSTRIPLREDRLNCVQVLANTGLIYSGYSYDFFITYYLESFMNIFNPIRIDEPGDKIIAVYFSENPMYITPGFNIRYENGIVLSASVPLLISSNSQSRMRVEDLIELHRNTDPDFFKDEKKRGILDPFDPWFVKWKINCSISFPVRFNMTSSEMMRNFLLMKNRKKHKKINIDKKIEDIKDEDTKRLEQLRKKRKEVIDSQ